MTAGSVGKTFTALPGNSGQVESSFSPHTLSLSNYAGRATLLRFNYAFLSGANNSWYYQTSINPPVGWFVDNIVITNTQQLINIVTNSTASTNFTFTPTVATNYNLEARALIFTEFPLDWGPTKQVTVISAPPTILLNTPVITNSQIRLDFTLQSGSATTFKLLNADQVSGPWTTNASAVLTTNVPGSSFRFTTATNGGVTKFYRVQTP